MVFHKKVVGNKNVIRKSNNHKSKNDKTVVKHQENKGLVSYVVFVKSGSTYNQISQYTSRNANPAY